MKSKLARDARIELQVRAMRLSAEQRLNAYLQHNQLMAALSLGARTDPAIRKPRQP